MELAVIGVNHNTCPIEVREKVSFTHTKAVEGMIYLRECGIEEVVILSTCNRSEIYIYDRALKESVQKVREFYKVYAGHTGIESCLFVKTKRKAIEHLYEVAAGLDSIVIGEDQILGQVKDAHYEAMKWHTSGKVLNKVFREAVTTAKYIKSSTKISEQALSISRIAVKFLKEKQGSLEGKVGLLIGAGKMNQLAIKYLLEEKVDRLYMMNRTHTKTVSLAEQYKEVEAITYEERYEILSQVDFVISATSSPHIILKYDEMPKLYQSVHMMDIAMPRDIDPVIAKLPYAYVYDIDDLKAISEANNIKRQELGQYAKEIILESIEELMEWRSFLEINPLVTGLAERCEQIEKDTLESLYKKIDLAEADKVILEKMLGVALKKVVREPIAKLRSTTDPDQRELYKYTVRELFGLQEERKGS